MLPRFTFFFANIEKYVNRGSIAGSFASVPIQAFRDGDFSSILTTRQIGTDRAGRPVLENTIFDPLSTGTVNGVTVRNVFPGNIIPKNRFDPVAAKIQNYFPLPSRPGLQNNWQQAATTVRKNEVVSVKIDHSLTDKSRLNFFFQSYRAKFGNNGADGLAPLLSRQVRQQRRGWPGAAPDGEEAGWLYRADGALELRPFGVPDSHSAPWRGSGARAYSGSGR